MDITKIAKFWFSFVWGVILFVMAGLIQVVTSYITGGTDIWISGLAQGAKWGFGTFLLALAIWSVVEMINKPKKGKFDKFGGV